MAWNPFRRKSAPAAAQPQRGTRRPVSTDPRMDGGPVVAGPVRMDSWQNPYTGLGTDRDKVYQGMYFAPFRISDVELLALYNGSDIAAKICEARPKEMFRRGYELEVDGDKTADDEGEEDEKPIAQDDLAELIKYGENLKAKERLLDAAVWGNCFGGALVIIGAQDGLPVDQPLAEKNISTIRFLNMVDRRFVFVHKYYDDQLKPNYGEPELYRVCTSINGSGQAGSEFIIHESRVIRFGGARTDILTRLQLAGWDWSVLQRAYEQMRNFDSTFQAVGNLVSDASQAVFKIENLISMLTSGEKDNLQTRMALVDMSRSVCRAVMVDAEKEGFERTSTSFAGLPEVLDRFMMRLSAAVDIPVTILLGRSAAGMNATGDADFRAFYASIADEQNDKLAPKLKRLYHILALAKDGPLGGRDVHFKIKFAPLWQPSDTEQAQIEYQTAQKDQIYATIGAVTPADIALSRWGKNGFNGSGMAAFDADQAEAEKQNDKMFGGMLNPPPELTAKKKGSPGQDGAGQAGGAPGQQPAVGPDGKPVQQAGAPIGAAASPFGQTNNPVKVMAQLHQPPEPPKK